MSKSRILSGLVSDTGALADGTITAADIGAQPALVSGTTIKTVNGTSLLGSGNLQIDGGVTSFNARVGAVVLGSADVTGALGFTPVGQSNIDASISALVDAAPGTLDTLNELAAALGDDPNFATTVTNSIAARLPLAGGTMTGALTVPGITVSNASAIVQPEIRSTVAAANGYDKVTLGLVANSGVANTRKFEFGVIYFANLAAPAGFIGIPQANGTGRYLWVDNNGKLRSDTNVTSVGGTGGTVFLDSGNYNSYALPLAGGTMTGAISFAGTQTWPTFNQSTTGTASNVTGTVAIANGGTGATTRQEAIDALAGSVISGQYLRGNGTDVVMSAIQAADVPTLNQSTTGSAGSVAWTGVTGKPTTVSGFGITNALVRGGGIGNIDFNAQRTLASGIYSVDGAPTNGPAGVNYSNFIQMYERGDTAAQLVIDYSSGRLYTRGIQTGTPTYSAWRTQLDDGNYNSYSPTLTGTGASGTWGISISGNAATATSTAGATNCTFTADAADRANITTRVDSGFYQHSAATTANGWPVTSNGWYHMLACTHNNDANYYSMQIAGSFYNNTDFYIRSTNGSGTTGWVQLMTTSGQTFSGSLTMAGNVTAYSDERLKKDWIPLADDFVARMAAEVKSGTYTRTDTELRQAGVSAQDWQKLLPETVQTDTEGMLSVAYGNAALVAAVELAKDNVDLRARLLRLESIIEQILNKE